MCVCPYESAYFCVCALVLERMEGVQMMFMEDSLKQSDFDFLKPSGSNLHFRFFFNTSYLAQLYMNDGISKYL